jgi:hypothetical protein
MVKPIHKRQDEWRELPFASLQEVADFTEMLAATAKELGSDPTLSVSLDCGDRDYKQLTLDDLRALSAEVAMDEIRELLAMVAFVGDQPVTARLRLLGRPAVSVRLSVHGKSGAAVDGAKVQAKADIDKRLEQLKKDKHVAALGPRESGANTVGQRSTTSRWRRWLNHPWAVQVGGGVAAGVILAAVLLLLHWP